MDSCVKRKSFPVATSLLLAATLTPTPVFAFLRGAEREEGTANLNTLANFINNSSQENRESLDELSVTLRLPLSLYFFLADSLQLSRSFSPFICLSVVGTF
jgi:hypothetical protein